MPREAQDNHVYQAHMDILLQAKTGKRTTPLSVDGRKADTLMRMEHTGDYKTIGCATTFRYSSFTSTIHTPNLSDLHPHSSDLSTSTLRTMRFSTILVALLSTFSIVSALSIFTTPDVDTTSEGALIKPEVPAPQPPARFRQATRAGVIARQKQGPARRQISSSPICNRGITGSTPYAVFTDAFFFTNNQLGNYYAASQTDCYADCEANPGKSFWSKILRDSRANHSSLRGRYLCDQSWS
jgi:hypothetical protein